MEAEEVGSVASTSLVATSEIVQPETQIALSERDWEQFREALEADGEPTEAAERATRRYNWGRMDGNTYEWSDEDERALTNYSLHHAAASYPEHESII